MKTTDLIPLILHQLVDEDKYGYDIVKQIEEDSRGIINIKQPTLYSLLKKLEQNKFITSYWKDSEIGGKRHYYQITANGKSQIETYPPYSKLIQDCCNEEGSPTLSGANGEQLVGESYSYTTSNLGTNAVFGEQSSNDSSPIVSNDASNSSLQNNEIGLHSHTEETSIGLANQTPQATSSNSTDETSQSNSNKWTSQDNENISTVSVSNMQNEEISATLMGNDEENQKFSTLSTNYNQENERSSATSINNQENTTYTGQEYAQNSMKSDDFFATSVQSPEPTPYRNIDINIGGNVHKLGENNTQNSFIDTFTPSKIDLDTDFRSYENTASPTEIQNFSEEIKVTPINLVSSQPVTNLSFGNNDAQNYEKFESPSQNYKQDNAFSSITSDTQPNENTTKSINIFDIIEPIESNSKPALKKSETVEDNTSNKNISNNFDFSPVQTTQDIATSPTSTNVMKDNVNLDDGDLKTKDLKTKDLKNSNNSQTNYTATPNDSKVNSGINLSEEKANKIDKLSHFETISDMDKNLGKTNSGLNPKLAEQVTNIDIEPTLTEQQVEIIDHDSVPYANYVNLQTDASAKKRRKALKLQTAKMVSTSFVLVIMLAISLVIAFKTSFTRLYCICLVTFGLITIFYPLLFAKNKTKMRLKYCTRPFVYNITMDFFVKLSIFLILFTLVFAYNINICSEFKDIFTFANASNFVSPLMFSSILLVDFGLSALFFKRFTVRIKK